VARAVWGSDLQLHLDVAQQWKTFAGSQANQLTLDGLSFAERSHSASFDAIVAPPYHVQVAAVFSNTADQRDVIVRIGALVVGDCLAPC
jgi:hypothetical protein